MNVGDNLGMGLVNRRQAEPHEAKEGLDDKTLNELKEIAKEKGISYSGLKKADLLKELKQSDTTKELKENYNTK